MEHVVKKYPENIHVNYSLSYNIFQYLFLLIVIISSGNPVIYNLIAKENVYPALATLCALYVLVERRQPDLRILLVVGAFISLILIQYITFGSLILNSSLGLVCNIVTGAVCFSYIRNCASMYVKIMVVLSIISLILFSIDVFSNYQLRNMMSFAAFDYGRDVVHIGIHNFNDAAQAHRNSGFFWEPGAFSGYLVVALMLNLITHRRLSRADNAILILAIASTQSSTGYIAFFVLLYGFWISKFRLRSIDPIQYSLVIIIFSILTVTVLTSLPFLIEKISDQFFDAAMGGRGHELSRFGNAYFDWQYIRQRPFFGWSMTPETRGLSDFEMAYIISAQGNGLSGSLVRFGIFGFLTLAASILYSFYKYSSNVILTITAFIVLSLLLVGEQYLMFPLFFGFMFISALNPKGPLEKNWN